MKDIIRQVEIDGQPVFLAYTVRAMLDINRLLKQEDGEAKELVQVVLGDDPADYELFFDIVEILNSAAAALRQSRGFEVDKVRTAEDIINTASPKEYIELKKACMDAILAGLGREEDNSEADMGLAELEKKNYRQRRK